VFCYWPAFLVSESSILWRRRRHGAAETAKDCNVLDDDNLFSRLEINVYDYQPCCRCRLRNSIGFRRGFTPILSQTPTMRSRDRFAGLFSRKGSKPAAMAPYRSDSRRSCQRHPFRTQQISPAAPIGRSLNPRARISPS
jgi:hypothetical protein